MEIVNHVIDQTKLMMSEKGRRIGERTPVTYAVKLQFVDDDRTPVGMPVLGVTKDISHGGIGVIISTPAPSQAAYVEFPELSLPALLVEFTNECSKGPFHVVGGGYCVDWSEIGIKF